MSRDGRRSASDGGGETAESNEVQLVRLGASLRRAWLGYQRLLDEELAAAGFDDRGFPDGRVLRMCSGAAETTISQIGRQLGITRQGASKSVASLADRGYVAVRASTTNGREKVVRLTPRAADYLAAQRKAGRAIERQLRSELGEESFASLSRLLEALGGDEQPRMREYLRKMMHRGGLWDPED
ncbi:MAG: MarR family winged helix-turn-helix transcriptional regulator [Acidimicrobiales bacterium]|jgi:DNA-binding MarR family transcriptional regulator